MESDWKILSPVVKASLKERHLSFNKTMEKLQISDLEIYIGLPLHFCHL